MDAQTSQPLLQWSDVLKLLVTVLTALAAIRVRHIYERRRERASLEEALWRSIGDDPKQFDEAIRLLDRVVAATKEGKVAVMSFDLPKVTIDAACRLSQLNPNTAGVYASYVSYVNLATAEIGRLQG